MPATEGPKGKEEKAGPGAVETCEKFQALVLLMRELRLASVKIVSTGSVGTFTELMDEGRGRGWRLVKEKT